MPFVICTCTYRVPVSLAMIFCVQDVLKSALKEAESFTLTPATTFEEYDAALAASASSKVAAVLQPYK